MEKIAGRLRPTETITRCKLDVIRFADDLVELLVGIDHRRREQAHGERPSKRIRFIEMLELQQTRAVHQPQSLADTQVDQRNAIQLRQTVPAFRFHRDLSLVSRPFLALVKSESPLVVICPSRFFYPM